MAAARRDAAIRFVLYTALGSAVMLLGLLLVALRTGTTDLAVLAGRPARRSALPRTARSRGLPDRGGPGGQGADVAAAHLAATGAHDRADRRLGAAGRGAAEDGHATAWSGSWSRWCRTGMHVIAPWLGALGVAGILWAGLACLAERDLKRLIAFSSVAHMGFVLLGIASMTPQRPAGRAVRQHRARPVTGLLFFVVGALKDRHHTADLMCSVPACGTGCPGWAGCWPWARSPGWACPGWRSSGVSCWRSPVPGRRRRRARRPGPAPGRVLAAIGTVVAAAYLAAGARLIWHGPRTRRHDRDGAVMGRCSHATRPPSRHPLVLATVTLGLLPGTCWAHRPGGPACCPAVA